MRRSIFVFLLSALAVVAGAADGLREGKEISYATVGEKELLLDWFRPDDDKTYPGIILIHGGGWTGGSRKAFEPMAKELATAGYVVANVDYRLATEAKFPGAVVDCKAAVRWMRGNAENLGLDLSFIAAIGGSAGGHLAGMIANTGETQLFDAPGDYPENSDSVQAIIMMGAGVDQVARVKESKSGSIKNCVIFFGGEYDEVPELYAQGSPITHISESTPPTLMIDGEKDRPGERYVDYRKKLDEFGVRNEFVMVPGAKHGAWGKEPYRSQFRKAMLDFLSSVRQ
ncbi:MAG: esterase [Verrucomicrobiales bacterium]|nr:esterase [Verrucomicrobiales bacterium]